MRFSLFLLCFLLSFGCKGASAEGGASLSATDLRQMCTSARDLDYGYCAGYVTAVAHALLAQDVSGQRACNHGAVKSQQLVDTFNAWAELFPEKMGEDADTAVAAALARAFPCPR
jgi:hypothetical protein